MTVDGLSIEATSTAAETEVVNMVECGGNMVRTVANRGTCPGSRGNQPREPAERISRSQVDSNICPARWSQFGKQLILM